MIAGSPEVVEAAADDAQRAGRDLGEVAEDVSQHGQAATNQWEGVASDAALRHITALAASTRVGADVLGSLGPVLRTYAVELRTAQREWAHGQALAAAGATALGTARADTIMAAAMEADDPQRSLATQDAADAVRSATTQKNEGAADMAAAVQRAAVANDQAARAVNDLTGQLSGMDATTTTASNAGVPGSGIYGPPAYTRPMSTTPTVAAGNRDDEGDGHRHGWLYNALGGAGNGLWKAGPGAVGDLESLSPLPGDKRVAAKIEDAHDWLERWYGADTDSDASHRSDVGAQVATFAVPGKGWITGAKVVTRGIREADAAGGIAPWLARVLAGTRWHRAEQARLTFVHSGSAAEVSVLKPGQTIASTSGKFAPRYNRVDLYDPNLREIVSMKHTQLWRIKPETAKKYLDELATKYPPGTIIADTATNRGLGIAGRKMNGQMILHVPVQNETIPKGVMQYAKKMNIDIREGSQGLR